MEADVGKHLDMVIVRCSPGSPPAIVFGGYMRRLCLLHVEARRIIIEAEATGATAAADAATVKAEATGAAAAADTAAVKAEAKAAAAARAGTAATAKENALLTSGQPLYSGQAQVLPNHSVSCAWLLGTKCRAAYVPGRPNDCQRTSRNIVVMPAPMVCMHRFFHSSNKLK